MKKRKIFVLDTNVLMHDPTSLFRFEEHDLFIPMVVLEELDGLKKGTSESARSARQVSRFLDELMTDKDHAQIEKGLAAARHAVPARSSGAVAATSQPAAACSSRPSPPTPTLPGLLPGNKPDNSILVCGAGAAEPASDAQGHPGQSRTSTCASRRRSSASTPRTITTTRSSTTSICSTPATRELPADFWATHGDTHGELAGRARPRLLPHQGPAGEGLACQPVPLSCPTMPMATAAWSWSCSQIKGNVAELRIIRDYRHGKSSVWGIHAKNREQNFALNLLLDPDIDFVTLLGTAGTGKTLLTLAAGLAQTMDEQRYREIIMTRVTVPVGEDIGFLPGTEEEKMTPWMGALMDNLEVLTQNSYGRRLGTRGHQRPARQAHQDPLAELHARPHLPQSPDHHRRGAEPHRQADEDADHARGPGLEDDLPGQSRPDRHAVSCRRPPRA